MTKTSLTAVALLVTGLSRIALAQPPPPPTIEYYHLDAVGSVRAVTNETGQVVRRHQYFPFGEEYLAQGGNDPRRFTGKERDPETGLDYFGARHYASRTGRFTTTDPVYTWQDNLMDPQLWNRYAYAKNNPLRFRDPDGRCVYPGADCAQYVLGISKAVANAVPDAATLLNIGVNVLIAPFTDFRFGEAPRFTAANEDQRRGMFAADMAALLSPLAEPSAPRVAKAFSRTPKSLMDEMVMEAAQQGAGVKIIDNLGDGRYKGMEKWSYSVKSKNGRLSEVHYVRDPQTGKLMDFKFAHHAEGHE